MKKNIINIFSGLNRVFNRPNFNKFLIIFIVGFVSRILVGYLYNVNVYLDFLSLVSILYYICMSAFIVLVHEFVDYFNFNFIPSFSFINEIYASIINIFGFIIRMLISMNSRIFSYKLEDIKISSIVKGAKLLFSIDKATMEIFESNYSKNSNITSITDSKPNKVNAYILEKNDGDEPQRIVRRRNGVPRYRTIARREEVRLIREEANSIAQERLRSGLMGVGEVNFDANTSSQVGITRLLYNLRRYEESLSLQTRNSGPIEVGINDNHTNMEPRDNRPRPMEPQVNNNPTVMSPRINFENFSTNNNQYNTNNNYTYNNQGNTDSYYNTNNQDSTNNNTRNN